MKLILESFELFLDVDGEDEGRKAIFDLTGKLSEADELFDSG